MLRLAMVPLFAFLLLFGGGDSRWRLIAAAVFGVAALTDLVDGILARRWGLVTDFGKVADPIADKALIGAALIVLSLREELSWIVTLAILLREVAVTLARLWVLPYGVIAASQGGKAKTVLQTVGLVLLILPLGDGVRALALGVMIAAVVVTVATGIEYLVRAYRLRRAALVAEGGR